MDACCVPVERLRKGRFNFLNTRMEQFIRVFLRYLKLVCKRLDISVCTHYNRDSEEIKEVKTINKICPVCNEEKDENDFYKSRPVCCKRCDNKMKWIKQKETYDPRTARDISLRRHYGISLEEYELMLFRQGGVCAVCGNQETYIHAVTRETASLVVDHNHETNQVRELLCYKCNFLLGMLEKNPDRIKKLYKYLKKHSM